MYTMYEIILIQNDGELIDYLISVIKCLLNVYCKFMKTNLQVNLATYITNGAKLGVAAVAHATPLFLPRPKIMYINMLHISAPPARTYLVCATPVLSPDWRH